MMIANHFNDAETTGMQSSRLTIRSAAPVVATPAMIGIIAVTVVVSAGAGAAGYAVGR